MYRVTKKLWAALAVGRRDGLQALRHFDFRGGSLPVFDDLVHLDAAMTWLCLAQDVCSGAGVSAAYSLYKGWDVAYPETSGYIIATFLAYADLHGDDHYVHRAEQLGRWELDIQAENGGVLSSPAVSYTRVFNTGQVILGWCALFERTADEQYLAAAVRAGDYLLQLQELDGSWEQDTYCGARTYHARVAWALIRLGRLSGMTVFIDSARNNLKWVLARQEVNGWFRDCGFHEDDPITHVIVYTLRGLLESHVAGGADVSDLGLSASVECAAGAICTALARSPIFGIGGMLPAFFSADWTSRSTYSCLTGNAQLACLLLRLAQVTGNDTYRLPALQLMTAIKQTHSVATRIDSVRGAVAGSFPLYGGYCPNVFPNWATKFFADALMMQIDQKTLIRA